MELESHFGPFRDSVSVGARWAHWFGEHTIGKEIVFDAPDGIAR
jgi:hypothetical protein